MVEEGFIPDSLAPKPNFELLNSKFRRKYLGKPKDLTSLLLLFPQFNS
jgi:hypothetical protein